MAVRRPSGVFARSTNAGACRSRPPARPTARVDGRDGRRRLAAAASRRRRATGRRPRPAFLGSRTAPARARRRGAGPFTRARQTSTRPVRSRRRCSSRPPPPTSTRRCRCWKRRPDRRRCHQMPSVPRFVPTTTSNEPTRVADAADAAAGSGRRRPGRLAAPRPTPVARASRSRHLAGYHGKHRACSWSREAPWPRPPAPDVEPAVPRRLTRLPDPATAAAARAWSSRWSSSGRRPAPSGSCAPDPASRRAR